MRRLLFTITAAALSAGLLAGCAAHAGGDEAAATVVSGSDLSPDSVLAENADATTVNTDEWSEDDAIDVRLTGDGATSASPGVEASGSTVTISAGGVYRLSGSLDGGLVVDAPDDALVVLVLDGASIDNAEGAAIDVRSADDVAIHLVDGSTNEVSDAASYDDGADANAAIHADADLTISGTGALEVRGNGNDGITSTDDLAILSGIITVTAADDALRGKDALVVEGGTLDLMANGGDCLKSDQEDDETKGYILVEGGTIDLTAGDDGLQAQTDTVITGGRITAAVADDGIKGETIVSVGGGEISVTESTEAMEAAYIGIFDGVLDLHASDDGINASGLDTGDQDREADSGERLEISGGTITVVADFDGLDSNGGISITGGELTITSADNGGDGPLDANGEITVADSVKIMANGTEWDPESAQQMGGPGGPGGQMPDGPGGGQAPDGQMPPGGPAPDGPAPGAQAPDGVTQGEAAQ